MTKIVGVSKYANIRKFTRLSTNLNIKKIAKNYRTS